MPDKGPDSRTKIALSRRYYNPATGHGRSLIAELLCDCFDIGFEIQPTRLSTGTETAQGLLLISQKVMCVFYSCSYKYIRDGAVNLVVSRPKTVPPLY